MNAGHLGTIFKMSSSLHCIHNYDFDCLWPHPPRSNVKRNNSGADGEIYSSSAVAEVVHDKQIVNTSGYKILLLRRSLTFYTQRHWTKETQCLQAWKQLTHTDRRNYCGKTKNCFWSGAIISQLTLAQSANSFSRTSNLHHYRNQLLTHNLVSGLKLSKHTFSL